MGDPRPVMRRRVFAAVVLCAVITVLAPSPASAAVAATGTCQYGGKWRLTVEQYDATHLAVLFVIRGQDPGSAWQLFGSDNGHAFTTKFRVADPLGIVRVRWRPIDRTGPDMIDAAGSGSGNSCIGQVTF
jgi:hypothetical protein